jgi:large subunit ribosomal protein L31e
MAKKEDKPKTVLERTFNVPLRKEFSKVAKYKRAKKAIYCLRRFLKRHMKSDQIKLGKHLNELVWAKGIKNPPHHVKITAVKDEAGIVKAEIVGKPVYEEPKEVKKPEKPKLEEKAKEDKTDEGGKKDAKKERPKGKKEAAIQGAKKEAGADKPKDKKEKASMPKAKKKAANKPRAKGAKPAPKPDKQ